MKKTLFLLTMLILSQTVNATNIPDSLVIGYMPEVKEWKYFTVNERPEKEQKKLVKAYKKELPGTPQHLLYDKWKVAFNSMPKRSLDMYVDGYYILMATINNDIFNKHYDRIAERRNELMEFYELAKLNLDCLNEEARATNLVSPISVSRLRAEQYRNYMDFTILDSMANRDGDIENSGADRRTHWFNRIYKDKVHMMFIYPRLKEMLTSGDVDIDLIYLTHFAKAIHSKISLDKKSGIATDVVRSNFRNDSLLVVTRAEEIETAVENPYEIYQKTGDNGMTYNEAYEYFRKDIINILDKAALNFIATNDYNMLEKFYTERYQKETFDSLFRAEIINSSLQRHYSSNIYIECLREEYEAKPSYELAKQIGDRLLRKYLADIKDNKGNKQDLNDSFSYFKYAIGFFSEETDDFQIAEKVSTYIRAIQVLSQSSGIKDNKTKIKYIKEVENLYPEYPDAYFYEAELIREVAVGIDNKNGKYSAAPYFIVACDLYNKCLNKIKEYNDIQEPLVKSNLTDKVADINKELQFSRSHIPSTSEYHMDGYNHYVGTSGNFKYNGYSYKFTWIAVDWFR